MMLVLPFAILRRGSYSLSEFDSLFGEVYGEFAPGLEICAGIAIFLTLVFKNKHLRWIAVLPLILPVIGTIIMSCDDTKPWYKMKMGAGPIFYAIMCILYILVNAMSPKYIKPKKKPAPETEGTND